METAPKFNSERKTSPLRVVSRNEALISGREPVAEHTIPHENLEAKTIAQLKEEIQALSNKIAFTKNYQVPEAHLYPKDEVHTPLQEQLTSRQAALDEKMKYAPKGLLQKIKQFFSGE
jgi:hypothetical protein